MESSVSINWVCVWRAVSEPTCAAKRRGANTDPCGTPEVTDTTWELDIPLKIIFWVRWVKKLRIQRINMWGKFPRNSVSMTLRWKSRSKALLHVRSSAIIETPPQEEESIERVIMSVKSFATCKIKCYHWNATTRRGVHWASDKVVDRCVRVEWVTWDGIRIGFPVSVDELCLDWLQNACF